MPHAGFWHRLKNAGFKDSLFVMPRWWGVGERCSGPVMVMTVVSHRLLLASDCCSPLHVRLSLSHFSRSILVAGMTAQRRSELDWSYQTWPLALVMMLDLHAPHGTGDGSNSIGWENAPSSRRQRGPMDSLAHVVPTSAWSCPILSLILMEAWLSARSCTASMGCPL